MKTLIDIIKDNLRFRGQIVSLAKAAQHKQNKGSDLGILWTFVKPAMYIAVFYVAITLGFKGEKDIPGITCPYFVWLTIGITTWFYIQSMLAGGAGVFRKYKLYVTKVNYPIDIIPTILATSNLLVHFVLIAGAMLLTVFVFHVPPTIYWLQIPIYTTFMYLFSIAWSMASGLLAAISKDLLKLLQSVSQAFFWLSAILFDIHKIDNPIILKLFMFNPITFIIEGYRNSICRTVWIWQEPEKFLCYMCTFVFMVVAAVLLYKKLRKIIPDFL